MILILKIIFPIVLFFIVYCFIEYIFFKNNKRIDEAKGKHINNYSPFQNLRNGLEKNKKMKGLFYKKDLSLKKIGNPMKLNGFTYYLYKISILILFILLTISGGFSSLLIFAMAIAFFFPNIIIKSIMKKEKNEILGDLPNINDVLNIQAGSAGMDLGTALSEVFDIANCKRLKEKLIELSIEISLTKNIPNALDRFAQNFNITEIDSFVISLKQAVRTGRSKELLDSQSELLKDAALARVSVKTKEIKLWIGLVGGLIFLGLAPLIIYSFGIQLYSSFKNIF
ncbi:MAG: hypothetical protein LKF87_11240 [Clostridium tyrobutyricum]|jgi:pilus assembly protein TadC|uniref:type II secretion system F family protein n=1 Tax=Clostridium tyrobutyricum TaxID=1519 RepID=UPI00242D7B49|nr:hypothetical protein [Clostridium tyrobutyricum]MCH4200935.1 hypothetical protein [Clostridium tyrobutyricum]MCH4259514.1 hypothetical protein [Clostridium tyrobutyricum]